MSKSADIERGRFAAWRQRLTAPSRHLKDDLTRRQATLLSACLIGITLLFVIADTVRVIPAT